MAKTLVFIWCCVFTFGLSAETIEVKSKGEFADIQVKDQNLAAKLLLSGDVPTIKRVISQPNDFNPVVLYCLSSALLDAGEREQAAFWFYLGQLRGRSDANKSLDESAKQGMAVLNQRFGGPINQYAMKDIAKLKTTIDKVIQFDADNSRNYDPRWIALHGLDAFAAHGKVAFEPKTKWQDIDDKTRAEYYEGFKQAVVRLNTQK